MAARQEGSLILLLDNLAQDAADRAGTRMRYIEKGRRDGHFVQLTEDELAENNKRQWGLRYARKSRHSCEFPVDTNNNIIGPEECLWVRG